MAKALSFFKVYGPEDPARAERRMRALRFDPPQFGRMMGFDWGEYGDRSYSCVMVQPPLRQRQAMILKSALLLLRGADDFWSSKGVKYWDRDIPAIPAVMWVPPPIREDCEFQKPPPRYDRIMISFA